MTATVAARPSPLVRGLGVTERAFIAATEWCAGILVATVAVMLLTGVFSRYVLDKPLVWADAIASLLFMWMAMLGAVVAMQRNEHMRMTVFVAGAKSARHDFWEALALAAAGLYLALTLPSSLSYAAGEAALTDPALDISNVWKAAAVPTGFALMIIAIVGRLGRIGNWSAVALAVTTVGAIAVGLYAMQPVLEDLGNYNLLIFFVGIVALAVFAGVPIAFAFCLATVGYLGLTSPVPLVVISSRMEQGMTHLVLLAVPMFVILGLLMEMTGMARALVAFLANLIGHVPGGLSYVLIGAMYLVSGISGSKAADMAALAPVLYPEMRKRGVDSGEFAALLCATGAQTETVPPSLVLIVLGSVAGISIGALFVGGLLPALIVGMVLCVVVWHRNRGNSGRVVVKPTRKHLVNSFVVALPALALPFLIRAAVVEGVATATEVSTIGIAYTALVGLLVYRQFDLRRLWQILISTASLSGAILLIIGAATAMAWCLTQSGFSQSLADLFQSLPGGKLTFIAASIPLFIVLGSLLEGVPAIVLFAPLLFPIASDIGVHEVHYAMIAILAMGIGLFAPPFGVGYYTACAISQIDPAAGIRPIRGYIAALVVGLLIVAAIPWISIGFLPPKI
jgi:tripartite ATP-independent transporter DctM subunit